MLSQIVQTAFTAAKTAEADYLAKHGEPGCRKGGQGAGP